jgi:hypothetical protein
VRNTYAADIAEIVKEVYQDRMVAGGASGGRGSNGRPSNPMEFFQMLRSGRPGEGSSRSTSNVTDSIDRMSIGVDERTNSVVVCAADPLFQEVKLLVEQLDEAAGEKQETVQVVNLHGISPQAAQKALSTLLGESASTGSNRSSTRTPSGSSPPSSRSSSRYSGRSSSERDRATSDSGRFERPFDFFRGFRGGGFPMGPPR